LNNLVTNVIKTLQPGEGNYAFATNVKGRVVFDVNMLVLDDRLWLDVDERMVKAAMAHLERYIITEDVRLEDISSVMRRVAVMGPKASELVSRLRLGNLAPMSQLQHVTGAIAGADVRMLRNDFTGLPTADFVLAGEGAVAASNEISRLAGELALPELYADVIEILRIEAGIPRSVDDIDDSIVPPETGQIERGISYHKGCYLGQEVIERMRSHGILARTLVGMRIDGDSPPPKGAAVKVAGQEVGRVTSCCWSETLQSLLALGYVKLAHSKAGTTASVVTEAGEHAATVVALPVSRRKV
jgi:folate-binding protein YgfZ